MFSHERGRDSMKAFVCVCVCERECKSVRTCKREREREKVFLCEGGGEIA